MPTGGQSPARVLVLDLFGVVARDQSERGKRRLEALLPVAPELFWDAYWALRPGYDRGELDGPAYWALVGDRLGHPLPAAARAELVAADVASWSEVDETMVALLPRLVAQGERLALLSNIPRELAAHHRAAAGWLDWFAEVYFSCQIGLAKPDPALFAVVAEHLGVEPAGLVLVDDRADNVAAARACGWQTHLFVDRRGLEAALDGPRRRVG